MTEMQQNATELTPDQENYLEWLILPVSLRVPQTKTDYAEQKKFNRTTLWRWEDLPYFDSERKRRIRRLQKDNTPLILDTLKNKALTGDVQAIRTWLEWVEGIDNKLNIEHSGNITQPVQIIFKRNNGTTDVPIETGTSTEPDTTTRPA